MMAAACGCRRPMPYANYVIPYVRLPMRLNFKNRVSICVNQLIKKAFIWKEGTVVHV